MVPWQGYHSTLFGLILGIGLVSPWGCGPQSLIPRMPAYIGPIASQKAGGHSQQREGIPPGVRVGLWVRWDSTAPGAAPPLTDALLTILRNRITDRLEQDFSLEVMTVFPPPTLVPKGSSQQVVSLAQSHQLPFVVLAIFSGTEAESPTELGEERMMTRMPGITVECYALVELALVDGRTGKVIIQAAGQASDSMDQLTSPLGGSPSPDHHPRDILRANAGEKALDQALFDLRNKWNRSS